MADVELKVTVPEEYITKVLHAFNTITDSRLDLMRSEKDTPGLYVLGKWEFIIAEQGQEETTKAFAERVVRELVVAAVKMVSKAEDDVRYKNAVAAIPVADASVEEDIVL